jgi:hypothetical protein
MNKLRYEKAILSFDAFQFKPSRRFLDLQEGLTTESAVLRDLFKLPASFIHDNVVEEYSRRTKGSSQSFSEN